MTWRPLVRLLIAVLVAGALWFTQRRNAVPGDSGDGPSVESARSGPATATDSERGFRDERHLREHFQKHGTEFGEIGESEYLRLAQDLRDRPAGGQVLESVRADGVITRFDRASGAFLAFDPDRTIRTFFRPNEGERYYTRQLARGRSEP
jgi:hypothetical protein